MLSFNSDSKPHGQWVSNSCCIGQSQCLLDHCCTFQIKHGFWFDRSGGGAQPLHSTKCPSDVHAAGGQDSDSYFIDKLDKLESSEGWMQNWVGGI